MPTGFATLDQNLPRFTGEESTEKKIQILQDYLYQLLEQLRYAFNHLDERNFNLEKVDAYQEKITSPIYAHIADSDGHIAALELTSEKLQLQFSDEIQNLTSSLTMTAEAIRTEISDIQSGLESSITQTAAAIRTEIQDTKNQLESSISQTASSITLSVTDNGSSSTISLLSKGVTISSQTITMSGITTFMNGLTTGTTIISGACIATGTITSDKIAAGSITADQIATGTITADKIAAGAITVSSLHGRDVFLYSDSGVLSGQIQITDASSAEGEKIYMGSNAIELCSAPGDIFLTTRFWDGSAWAEGAFIQLSTDTGTGFRCNIHSAGAGFYSCGTSDMPWCDVYADNATIQASDREKKKDITYDLDAYDTLFDALKPCSFRFKEGHERIHMGLISQDVEEALEACGLTSMDFAGFVKSPQIDEEGTVTGYHYALRYGEWIPVLIDQVQKLKKEVQALSLSKE